MIYLTQTQPTGIMALLPSLLMFGMIGLVFYFMIVKPQKKQRQEYQNTMESLKVGDTVVTRGGIRGVVVHITDDSFVIETGNTQVEFLKQALSYIDKNRANRTPSTTYSQAQNNDSIADSRFTDIVDEAKKNKGVSNMSLNSNIVDVYEFVVKNEVPYEESISARFGYSEEESKEIMKQLEHLELVSTLDVNGDRKILVDPRG